MGGRREPVRNDHLTTEAIYHKRIDGIRKRIFSCQLRSRAIEDFLGVYYRGSKQADGACLYYMPRPEWTEKIQSTRRQCALT